MEKIREITELSEKLTLSPYACFSASTRGRDKPCEPCPARNFSVTATG